MGNQQYKLENYHDIDFCIMDSDNDEEAEDKKKQCQEMGIILKDYAMMCMKPIKVLDAAMLTKKIIDLAFSMNEVD